jgi:hypothetical protein
MVLVQFFLIKDGLTNNNGEWHSININGLCNARLVNYMLKHSGNDFHVLQLQSDVFKTPYSGNSIVKCTNGVLLSTTSYTAFDQSHQAFHWDNIFIPGRVQFTLWDVDQNEPFAQGFDLILTFDIENLP